MSCFTSSIFIRDFGIMLCAHISGSEAVVNKARQNDGLVGKLFG